jgi:Zn-dependent protease with chaperone function
MSDRSNSIITHLPETPPQALDNEKGWSLVEESPWEGDSDVGQSNQPRKHGFGEVGLKSGERFRIGGSPRWCTGSAAFPNLWIRLTSHSMKGRRMANWNGPSRPVLKAVLARLTDPSAARPDRDAAEELDGEISRLYRRDRVVYLALLLGIGAIWIVAWIFEPSGRRIAIGVVVILSAAFRWFSLYKDLMTAVEPERASAEMLGRYTAEDLRDLLREVNEPFCREFDSNQRPGLFVIESKLGNACAMKSPTLRFIRRLNAVLINSHLLSVLDRDELRAVVGHELAHYHRYMSLYTRHHVVPILFSSSLVIWGSVLLCNGVWGLAATSADVWVAVATACFLGLGSSWILMLILILSGLGPEGHQEAELLCDYTAAKHFGVVPQINSLIKLAVRGEVYQVLAEEVAGVLATNTKHSIQEVQASAEGALPIQTISGRAARSVVREKLRPMRGEQNIFRPPLKKDSSLDNRRALVRQILRGRKRVRRTRHLDWERFDDRVRDSRLDETECEAYVNAILEDANATLVRSKDEVVTDATDSHPPYRDRILFLALTLPLQCDEPQAGNARIEAKRNPGLE